MVEYTFTLIFTVLQSEIPFPLEPSQSRLILIRQEALARVESVVVLGGSGIELTPILRLEMHNIGLQIIV
jgi:hypothetical protein